MNALQAFQNVVNLTTGVFDEVARFSANVVRDGGRMTAEVIRGTGELPATAIQETTGFAAGSMTVIAAVGAEIGQIVGLPRQFIEQPVGSAAAVVRNGGGGAADTIRMVTSLPATAIQDSAGLTAHVMTRTTSAATGICRRLAGLPIQVPWNIRQRILDFVRTISQTIASTFVNTIYHTMIDILRRVPIRDLSHLIAQTVIDPLILFVVILSAIALVFFFALKLL
ncbi:hypothetical protein NCS56_00201200 [Fusarium sp. Ph1]|nr:hypothetical protein NCS56_00201200 [Fusarium sp. Ph1]